MEFLEPSLLSFLLAMLLSIITASRKESSVTPRKAEAAASNAWMLLALSLPAARRGPGLDDA